ncbi:MAG: hypothetical protein QOF51_409 [Chloroflexota bacterium]|jgi:hypothetical protein|nr:hypothetical protein [Chloroflexota bacterium]
MHPHDEQPKLAEGGGTSQHDVRTRLVPIVADPLHIPCPVCGFPIGAVRGSKAAICANCGFKDGCC